MTGSTCKFRSTFVSKQVLCFMGVAPGTGVSCHENRHQTLHGALTSLRSQGMGEENTDHVVITVKRSMAPISPMSMSGWQEGIAGDMGLECQILIVSHCPFQMYSGDTTFSCSYVFFFSRFNNRTLASKDMTFFKGRFVISQRITIFYYGSSDQSW